jgi:hypothetical protein
VSDGDADLVQLTVVSSEIEAELIRGLLATEGIESVQRQTDFAAGSLDGSPSGGPRAILVLARDLEAARALIAGQ